MTTTKTKRPFQHYPLAEIVWDDASGFRHGWMDKVDDPKPQLVISVGFLIKDTPDYVIYASDVDGDGAHNGRTQIPRGMIKTLRILRKVDSAKETKAKELLAVPSNVE